MGLPLSSRKEWGRETAQRERGKNGTHDTGNGELPVVKRKMHDRLGVAALTATAAVRSEAFEHALGYVDVDRNRGSCRRKRRERAKAEVARALALHSSCLFLDAFRDELEELLRVLVLT
jgi:hypothetical protein